MNRTLFGWKWLFRKALHNHYIIAHEYLNLTPTKHPSSGVLTSHYMSLIESYLSTCLESWCCSLGGCWVSTGYTVGGDQWYSQKVGQCPGCEIELGLGDIWKYPLKDINWPEKWEGSCDSLVIGTCYLCYGLKLKVCLCDIFIK